jgi:EpsI family protein
VSERPESEPQSSARRTGPKRAFDAGGWGIPVVAALCLSGLAFAHRGLLTLRPRTALAVPLSTEVENWFFEPSDTSPALVVLLVGWLLYRRRGRLLRTAGRPGAPWLTALLLGTGLAIFVWALRTGAREIQALTVLFEVLAAAHAFGGVAALRIAVVPAAFLVFALPLPSPLLNAIVWKFQIWTAEYAGFLLNLLGQSAFVSGDQIYRSNQAFQIIETCSGLRTIETLSMLAVLMVDLFGRRGWHAVILLVLSPFVAFWINGFRALALIFNPLSDIASIHNLQGIVMLLAGVLVLYYIDGGLERVLPQRPAPRLPRIAPTGEDRVDLRRWGAVAASVLVVMALSLGLSRWQLPLNRPSDPAPVIDSVLEGWRGRDAKTDRIFLGQTGFLHILHREYLHRGKLIDMFVATGVRTSRYRSFHAPKTALPGTGWIVDAHETLELDGRELEELQVRRGTRRMLIHHWREGTADLGTEAVRTALALDVSPFRRADHPVVIRLTTPIDAGPAALEAGRTLLRRFSGQIRPALQDLSSPGEA